MSVFRSSLTDMRQTIAVGCAQVTVILKPERISIVTGHGFIWVAKRRTVVPLIGDVSVIASEAIHWRRGCGDSLDRRVLRVKARASSR